MFFPSLKDGWGFTAPQNKITMENQEEKETSLEYFYERVLDAPDFYPERYRAILDGLDNAKKIYEKELKEAYEKGYEEGVKYTDGLISDEKFPF